MISVISVLLVLLNSTFISYSEVYISEIYNIMTICCVTIGALFSFLVFNCFPAKIFMGDTGSLAIGSLVASVAVFTKLDIFIPILGIMFVLSSVSVIIQVAYYKLTKKRIFLMAPLHHHFQMQGVHEVRITICYTAITLLVGAIITILSIII